MQAFPHHYQAAAAADRDDDVLLTSPNLTPFPSASPAEFGGPGNRWSPETLLTAAVADCFILTFRAVARASKLPWTSLRCEVTGTLDRIDRTTQFTGFDLTAHLHVPPGTSTEQAELALERAEHNCLVSNSLKGAVQLRTDVHVAHEAEPVLA